MRNSRNFRLRRPGAWYPAAAALAGLPLLGAIVAVPAAAAPSGGWTQQIQWTAQQVAPGVTVRTGVLANPAADMHGSAYCCTGGSDRSRAGMTGPEVELAHGSEDLGQADA